MVGSVNSKEHVEAVGNTFVGLNLSHGLPSNPRGGIFSAPVKNASISPSTMESPLQSEKN